MSKAYKKVLDMITGPGGPFEVGDEFISYPDSEDVPHHQGVTYKVFKSGPQTIRDFFDLAKTRGFLERDFLVYEDERYTFGQTYTLAGELANIMKNNLGVNKGDHVAILSRNCPEYIIAFIAITSIGAIAVPMNSWWTAEELRYGLENSDSKLIFCDEQRCDAVAEVVSDISTLSSVLLWRSKKKYNHPKIASYTDTIALGYGKSLPLVELGKDDPAILMYTSGTTGKPKGVVQTNRGVTHALNAAIVQALVGMSLKPKGGEKPTNTPNSILLTVPLFHATGLHAIFLLSTIVGRKIVMQYKWDAERALQLIEREKVTHFTGVPTMVLELMQHKNFDMYDTSTLQQIGGGGAPPPPSMVHDVGKKFKRAAPTQGYGMTETNAVVTFNSGDAYVLRPTSCGQVVPFVQVEIWDDNHSSLGPEQVGRVMVKGANIMKGYYKNPKATRESITVDGFLDTGDIGKLSADNFLYILDRAKDMVIRGGENISCAEVEAAVYEVEAVAECAVIGVPHPTLQEEVAVAVYAKEGQEITLEQIQLACGNLAKFKRPVHLFKWPERLPRGATGKIVKKEIRSMIQMLQNKQSKL